MTDIPLAFFCQAWVWIPSVFSYPALFPVFARPEPLLSTPALHLINENNLYQHCSIPAVPNYTFFRSCGPLGKIRRMRVKPKPNKYDTSTVKAKFRVARINPWRKLDFAHVRRLNFDCDRDIEARLTGIVFRSEVVVNFRNLGISNLDEIGNADDWPNMGKAKVIETFKSNKDRLWYDKWGKEVSNDVKWGKEVSNDVKWGKEVSNDVKWERRTTTKKTRPLGRRQVVRPLPDSTASEKKQALSLNQYAVSLVQKGEYATALIYFSRAQQLDTENQVYQANVDKCKEWISVKRGR